MVSTCIITAKIDPKLQRAINSVAGLGEVVVVDTQGEPPQIYLHGYYSYPWNDDFAKARNFALEKATGKWILSLDADEWIDGDGWRKLHALDNELANRAYYTRLIDGGWGVGKYALDQVKIFPNSSNIRYIGRIHEQIAPSIAKLGMPFIHSGVNVYHDGYVNPQELHLKRQRNLRISNKWIKEEPGNPWANFWYNYIRTYQ